jgi:hypothetical protein
MNLLIHVYTSIYRDFCYGIYGVPDRYLEEPKILYLISTVNFYYIISKVIKEKKLVPDRH